MRDANAVVDQAIDALGILRHASDAALLEARNWLDNPGFDDPQLQDWQAAPFITIDNPDSRDLDQALLIEAQDDGYRVRYALADAAYYVRPGSALFNDALQRGATYYTPSFAAPMLPVELSEGLISLNPNSRRRALVFDIYLNQAGDVLRTDIVRALIISQAKLSYAGVQTWLDGLSSSVSGQPDDGAEYAPSLRLLETLGDKLICRSERRGVVPFDRSEADIGISGSPAVFSVSRRQRYRVEQFNEQISLLCNMQGAEMLMALQGHSDALQAVFRVHDAPLKKNTVALQNTLAALASRLAAHTVSDENGAENGPENSQKNSQESGQESDPTNDADSWRWQIGESLADYVRLLPGGDSHRRRRIAVQRQIMQAQRASVFKPEPGIHHALKAASYARFSSPMREIVGIFTHKELLEALGMQVVGDTTNDTLLREQVIDAANLARQTQRQLDKRIEFAAIAELLDTDLQDTPPPQRSGTLVGIRHDKLYIALDDLAIDVKLYRDDLEQQFDTQYQLAGITATPSQADKPVWVLGQGISLQVRNYDAERARYQFTLRSMDA